MNDRFKPETPLWARAIITLVRGCMAILAAFGWRELGLLAGIGLVGYGAALIYWPAGFLSAGLILTGVAIFGVRALGGRED